jgi:hypothetical protein
MRKTIVGNEEKIRQEALKLRRTKIETAKDVIKHMPRGLTLHDMKVVFIEHILQCNSYVKTSTARELDVNYGTLISFIHGPGFVPDFPPERRRGRPGKVIPEREQV